MIQISTSSLWVEEKEKEKKYYREPKLLHQGINYTGTRGNKICLYWCKPQPLNSDSYIPECCSISWMLAWEKYLCNKKLMKFLVKCFLNRIWTFIAKRIKVSCWTLFQILVLFGKYKLFLSQFIKTGYFKVLFCIKVSLGSSVTFY